MDEFCTTHLTADRRYVDRVPKWVPLCIGVILGVGVLPSAANAARPPTETVVHTFGNVGAYTAPFAGLFKGTNGVLYGTTSGNGSHHGEDGGGVFSLTPPAKGQSNWAFKGLFEFPPIAQLKGGRPETGVIVDSSGNVYGTTSLGTTNQDAGLIFKLAPPPSGNGAWVETILYDFAQQGGIGPTPSPIIMDRTGNIYGETPGGGQGFGSVYMLAPPGQGQTAWQYTTLYSFGGGSDGSGPYNGLVRDAKGRLFGVTYSGGLGSCYNSGCGTIFQLMPPSKADQNWRKQTIYQFSGVDDGGVPSDQLISDKNGALYGTTLYGGNANICGCGVVFKLSPPSAAKDPWIETVLYQFLGPTMDGDFAIARLLRTKNGELVGATNRTLFSLAPPTMGQAAWTETILNTFDISPDGLPPIYGVILDAQGDLVGVTQNGGTLVQDGVVYVISK